MNADADPELMLGVDAENLFWLEGRRGQGLADAVHVGEQASHAA